MNCFINGQGEVVVDSDAVLRQCIDTIGVHSTRVEAPKVHETYFPKLPPLDYLEVVKLQKLSSANKAESFDFISGRWIKFTQRWDLLFNLWNFEAIQMLERSFEARLVPLNKVWPDIPKGDEFRPIVIESPMYKFLELRFFPKLQSYLVNQLDKNQTGFIPGCGTSVNIEVLIENIKQQRKKYGECLVFIDYKSAYTTQSIEKDSIR